MIDQHVPPSYGGDDHDGQEVEPARFDVIRWGGGDGDIYYDGYLLYSKDLNEDGEDDLFEALVGLGRKMEARGYVEMVEQGKEVE